MCNTKNCSGGDNHFIASINVWLCNKCYEILNSKIYKDDYDLKGDKNGKGI